MAEGPSFSEELIKSRQDLEVHQMELDYQNQELRRVTTDLEMSRNRYLRLYHGSPAGYVTVNRDGVIKGANDTFARFVDRDSTQLPGVPLANFFESDDRHVFYSRWRAFSHNPEDKSMVLRLGAPENNRVVQLTGSKAAPTDDPEDEEGDLLLVVSDITQLHGAQQEIADQERYYHQLLNSLREQVLVVSNDYSVMEVNQAFLDHSHRDRSSIIGAPCYEVLRGFEHPCGTNGIPGAPCPFSTVVTTGTPAEYTHERSRPEGGIEYLNVLLSPVCDEEGRVTRIIESARDVTDSVRTRKELEFSRAQTGVHNHIARIFLVDSTRAAYQSVATALVESLQVDFAAVAEGDSETLRYYASSADSGAVTATPDAIHQREMACAHHQQLLPTDTPTIVGDIRFRGCDTVFRSAAVVRIAQESRTVGCVALACTERDISDQDAEQLSGIARFMAPIIAARLAVEREEERRRQAEVQIRGSLAEKDVLLAEIHHRVKNNLQVIASFLHVYALKPENSVAEALLVESEMRVQAMAQVHDLLYHTDDLARVDIRAYAASLLHNICAVYDDGGRIRTAVEGDAVFVGVDVAVPCALMLNEIVTNSFKYAFEGRGGGTVIVASHRRSDNSFVLSIRDDGIGIPADVDYSGKSTLGLHIVSILAQQLGASMQVESAGGTTVTFSIPLRLNEHRRGT